MTKALNYSNHSSQPVEIEIDALRLMAPSPSPTFADSLHRRKDARADEWDGLESR
jgi:hypothetical protein